MQAQQSEHAIGFSTISGLEMGWWIWNKGSSVKGVNNDQGWARSHFSAMVPVGAGVNYRYKRLFLGAKGSYAWYFDYQLIDSEDAIRNYDRTPTSTGNSVKFWKVGGVVGYQMVKLQRYAFVPNMSVGWFGTDMLHEQKESFYGMVWWSIGLEQQVNLGKWSLGIAPQYTQMHVSIKDSKYYNENHRMYLMGAELSLTYWIGL